MAVPCLYADFCQFLLLRERADMALCCTHWHDCWRRASGPVDLWRLRALFYAWADEYYVEIVDPRRSFERYVDDIISRFGYWDPG